ncbi:EAL domain-containing protein [Herminiimonas fonticola]|uniref:cyclic-guanylate-specific phosphodiesterase n=1 Tax=Herminiimonas fonticola TaxID=303380 RepID=A0A4R6G738_9BURK|nr:EAL domain-containing protein [Herminiimonas fonticola]RBA23023.1 putative signal transduction protein containing sensor and EAL domain [Herminiimonas fonticola]TDN89535.1 sensor c-di-GMP phosphodiesterase-like protein [Herminiimonas fonticola]
MNRIVSIGLVVFVGTLAIAAPIAASLYISHQQSLDIETASALSLADELQRRTDKTNSQIKAAFVELRKDKPADPCSEKNIQLMREIDISASYLQAVGHVANGRWMCSSLGHHGSGIELGPVDYISTTGASVRMQVMLSIAPGMRFIMIEKYGYAAIIHRELPLDVFEDQRDVSLASVNTSTGRLLLTRGVFKKEWLRPLPKEGFASFFDGDYVVAIRRSKEFDWTSVAAVPVKYVDIRSKKLSMVLVPVGIVAGILLAIAFYFLAKQQTSWPSILRTALKRKEFFLEYQPVIDLQTGRCVGAEALMRWRRSNGKLVAPDLFIPIAEESNLILRITARVLQLIERDMPALIQDHPDFHLAINLSAADLQSVNIVSSLRELMERTWIKPKNLMVEATERGFINTELAHDVARDFRDMGICVAIDDFGTGYSSLSYLTTFEVDYLKIDKSFVDTIGTDAATSTVVLHIIEMAKSLDIKMIAEGVETEMQAEFLRERGVQYAQGWLFAKAMPINELAQFLIQEKA